MDDKMEDADQPVQWLQLEQSSAPGDIFGEPVTKTRIGDEYQAQIPPLMTENERLQLIVLPSSHDREIDIEEQLMFGHSIPVAWIQDQPKIKGKTMKNKAKAKGSAKGKSSLLPVPVSSVESLSPDEHHSFVLALYIFGKNFGVVNRFIGNKGMRNVLSYYYGKFYKTDEHKKWLRYKKMKGNKKTMPGKIIFSDWRQDELFSRLFPRVTDTSITSLEQASKMYEDGVVSFERYVFTVRDIVGTDLLIESIGIGKGKRDLTDRRAKKLVKKRILHPEYASLNTEQIINLLNYQGDELNKPKLSEVFWAAVWPRLLARGWHSEKTINYAFQNSKRPTVFLPPGIQKFSRRALQKGVQYFECFKDVLDKVASEPELLGPDEAEPIPADIPVNPPVRQDHIQYRIVDVSFAHEEDGIVKTTKLRSMMSDTESDTEPTDHVQESFSSSVSGETIQESNSPAATHDSDGGIVLHETLTNQPDQLKDDGADTDQEVAPNGQRQGTRNRVLTAKALEALSTGSMNPKKKKRDIEDDTPRQVRAKTAADSGP